MNTSIKTLLLRLKFWDVPGLRPKSVAMSAILADAVGHLVGLFTYVWSTTNDDLMINNRNWRRVLLTRATRLRRRKLTACCRSTNTLSVPHSTSISRRIKYRSSIRFSNTSHSRARRTTKRRHDKLAVQQHDVHLAV